MTTKTPGENLYSELQTVCEHGSEEYRPCRRCVIKQFDSMLAEE